MAQRFKSSISMEFVSLPKCCGTMRMIGCIKNSVIKEILVQFLGKDTSVATSLQPATLMARTRGSTQNLRNRQRDLHCVCGRGQ
jgi:hypothetical protein